MATEVIDYRKFGPGDDFALAAVLIKAVLKQERRSVIGMQCVFRGSDGLRCAIGMLMSDEFVDDLAALSSEGYDSLPTVAIANQFDERAAPEVLEKHSDFLKFLCAHDLVLSACQAFHDDLGRRTLDGVVHVGRRSGFDLELWDSYCQSQGVYDALESYRRKLYATV